MILRRDGKNIQNCTKKDFNDLDNHNDVVTHLEPDILECEVMWALGSITFLQARLQKYMNWEISDVQAGFKKAEKPEIKLPASVGSQKM